MSRLISYEQNGNGFNTYLMCLFLNRAVLNIHYCALNRMEIMRIDCGLTLLFGQSLSSISEKYNTSLKENIYDASLSILCDFPLQYVSQLSRPYVSQTLF